MGEVKKENKGSKGNKVIVILLIVTIVVVVMLATFFGYMMITKNSSNSSSSNKTTTKETVKTVDLDEFVVNLAGGEGSYVKVTISLGYTKSSVETEITDNKAIIRDAINKTLMGKKASDFKETGGLDKIQNQLKSSINAVLSKGQITNVYFSNIVIQ